MTKIHDLLSSFPSFLCLLMTIFKNRYCEWYFDINKYLFMHFSPDNLPYKSVVVLKQFDNFKSKNPNLKDIMATP